MSKKKVSSSSRASPKKPLAYKDYTPDLDEEIVRLILETVHSPTNQSLRSIYFKVGADSKQKTKIRNARDVLTKLRKTNPGKIRR